MKTRLEGIAKKARLDSRARFTSLAHVLTVDFMKETWTFMNRRGAAGIDGETAREFEADLETRVLDLHRRLVGLLKEF